MTSVALRTGGELTGLDVRPYERTKPIGLMEAHVRWLREERDSTIAKIGIVILIALETLVLSLTLVGIPFVIQAYKISSRIAAFERFHAEVGKIPPSKDMIYFKSDTVSFNHVDDYAISNGVLWYRKRNSTDEWKAIYFDGYEKGKKPIKVSCDGCNLVVLDEDNYVHYKKVLKERRGAVRASAINGIEDETEKQAAIQDALHGDYYCVDKAENNNWKDRWFSLTIKGVQLNNLVNIFTGYLMQVPKDCLAWGMSQRGRLASYYEDILDRPLLVGTGVTTLLVLHKEGKTIQLVDPWLPPFCDVRIHMPESETSTYTANNMVVSASTALITGYEQVKDASHKTFKIYTQICDIDFPGINPVNGYTYNENETDRDVQVLPGESLKEHPLNLAVGERVTNKTTIVQNGLGNNSRELRIEGEKAQQYGYFHKQLTDDNWEFTPIFNGYTLLDEDFVSQSLPIDKPFETSVNSYEGSNENGLKVKLEHFGPTSTHATVKLELEGDVVELQLYHRPGMLHFMDKDELVRPVGDIQNPRLLAIVNQIFGGEVMKSLKIQRGDTEVSLFDGLLPKVVKK